VGSRCAILIVWLVLGWVCGACVCVCMWRWHVILGALVQFFDVITLYVYMVVYGNVDNVLVLNDYCSWSASVCSTGGVFGMCMHILVLGGYMKVAIVVLARIKGHLVG
jgi:hypothetical protein